MSRRDPLRRLRGSAPPAPPDAARLVRAVAAVLPVDGVGLTVHAGTGVPAPLAASGPAVALAESLQFTAGSGPDAEALRTGAPVPATERLLARRWPGLHHLLVTRTPLRSTLAVPLPGPTRARGGLSLYFTAPVGPVAVDLEEVERVAASVSRRLAPLARRPVLLRTADALRRERLWMAVGVLTLALRLPAPDALALLRGRAWADGRTADELAADLLDGRLDPRRLDPEDDADR
ncbi:GAF domain-containing protein [Geodermatophilus sp. SYSU D00815]